MRRWEGIMLREDVDEERREEMLLEVWEDGWEDWANPMWRTRMRTMMSMLGIVMVLEVIVIIIDNPIMEEEEGGG